ncbi:hypothetical protein [Bacillus testis]|uniref:hypothetical protein n=1 Tax=Bacillus testis TaxID=1622072 RepID=UPI00067F1ED2|nr:hypothetical protein [Bacillus testis]
MFTPKKRLLILTNFTAAMFLMSGTSSFHDVEAAAEADTYRFNAKSADGVLSSQTVAYRAPEMKVINEQLLTIEGDQYLIITYDREIKSVAEHPTIRFHTKDQNGKDQVIYNENAMVEKHEVVNGRTNQIRIKLHKLQDYTKYDPILPENLTTGYNGEIAPEIYLGEFYTGDVREGLHSTINVSIVAHNPGKVIVAFSEKVQLKQALQKEFYEVDGAEIEAIKEISQGDDETTVELTLKPGTIKQEGTNEFRVKPIESSVPLTEANPMIGQRLFLIEDE